MISAIAFVLFVRDKYTIKIFFGDIDCALEQLEVKHKPMIIERRIALFISVIHALVLLLLRLIIIIFNWPGQP